MANKPLPTQPISPNTALLQKKFYEQFAAQSEQLDKLGGQLITLELAIPGLYAAVLKLVHGKDTTLTIDGWLYFTFACWFLALLLTLLSLVPRRWKVDPTVVKGDAASQKPTLGLEDFFYQSAQHKRRLLIPAIMLFWAGILGAAILVL